jgi:hypothetical protein
MAPEGHPLPEDATTQTLNYALGNLGGKQKSWMTLPSNAPALPPVVPSQVTTNSLPSTVRGRGRPRKYRHHRYLCNRARPSRQNDSRPPTPRLPGSPMSLSLRTLPLLGLRLPMCFRPPLQARRHQRIRHHTRAPLQKDQAKDRNSKQRSGDAVKSMDKAGRCP